MDKRLFFFIVIVPTVSLSVSQLKKAHSAPTTISEYKEYKKEFISALQDARKELARSKTPQPRQVAQRLLFYRKSYHRDGELTDAANELYTISKEVNKHCSRSNRKKRDLFEDSNEFKFVEKITKQRECFVEKVTRQKEYREKLREMKNTKNLSA